MKSKFKQMLLSGWHDQRAKHLEKEKVLMETRFDSLDLPQNIEDSYNERYEMYIEMEQYLSKNQ